LQISHDRGWRAEQNGMALPIVRDPLGLMYIQPIGSGLRTSGWSTTVAQRRNLRACCSASASRLG